MKEISKFAIPSLSFEARATYELPKLEHLVNWNVFTGIPISGPFRSGNYWFDGEFWSPNDPWNDNGN